MKPKNWRDWIWPVVVVVVLVVIDKSAKPAIIKTQEMTGFLTFVAVVLLWRINGKLAKERP
jgi:hypothetical protein